MKNSDNMEILLLLCCLVGVIMFLCLSLAAINLGTLIASSRETSPDVGSMISERNQLVEVRRQKTAAKKQLEDQVEYLKGKITTDERKIAEIHKSPTTNGTAQEIEKLRKEMKELDDRNRELTAKLGQKKTDIGKFTWKDLSGSVYLKNPLIIECKENVLVIHPSKKVLNLSDLNNKQTLADLSRGYDGIVFLIRPNGFKTFRASFLKAEKISSNLVYEAIDADKQVDFSQGRSEG